MHWLWPWVFYVTLNKSQEIEFWVAVGTIGLALVTTITVIVQARVLTNDHRRFAQGYSPLLTIGHFYTQGNLFYELSISNSGYGPALDVSLQIEGTWLKREYEVNPENVLESPRLTKSHRLPILVQNATSLIQAGASWGFDIRTLEGGPGEAVEKENLDVPVAVLKYNDRFGNAYETRYTDFSAREYRWIQPNRFK